MSEITAAMTQQRDASLTGLNVPATPSDGYLGGGVEPWPGVHKERERKNDKERKRQMENKRGFQLMCHKEKRISDIKSHETQAN